MITKAQKEAYAKDPREYILKNTPTKTLLRAFRAGKIHQAKEGTEDWVSEWNRPVYLKVGKFSAWNPQPGVEKGFFYGLDEVRAELNTREHVAKK